MPSVLSMLDVIRLPNQGDGQAFDALSTRAMKVFNFDVVNDPDVKYYSWGAKFEPSYFNTFKCVALLLSSSVSFDASSPLGERWFFGCRWSHTVILAKEGPNDGLVSVQSAHWGEYQGTLENVNHLDLVGWVNPVRYTISEWVGKPISFKPASFCQCPSILLRFHPQLD